MFSPRVFVTQIIWTTQEREIMTPKKNKSHRKISKGTFAKTRSKTRKINSVQVIAISVIAVVVVAIIWAWIASGSSKAKQYDSPPPMTIDANMMYFATVKMAKGGKFVIELYADKAPITVNNFVFLAREGFYDGTTFHRVLEGFMAQGGDPEGTGGGGPGYQFVNEINDLKFDKAGVVAMANAGKDTNGSQFFITFGPYDLSESDYTIFGQVIEGMDVVNNITLRNPDQYPDYPGDMIESIIITEQ
jgi:cyclophilin family peptidyl-prolyl cis-trans isomerase